MQDSGEPSAPDGLRWLRATFRLTLMLGLGESSAPELHLCLSHAQHIAPSQMQLGMVWTWLGHTRLIVFVDTRMSSATSLATRTVMLHSTTAPCLRILFGGAFVGG